MTFIEAKDWYQNATSLERYGVRIRLFNCYPELTNEEDAFVRACEDEKAKKPLPSTERQIGVGR